MFSCTDCADDIAIDAIYLCAYIGKRPAIFRRLHLHIVARSYCMMRIPAKPNDDASMSLGVASYARELTNLAKERSAGRADLVLCIFCALVPKVDVLSSNIPLAPLAILAQFTKLQFAGMIRGIHSCIDGNCHKLIRLSRGVSPGFGFSREGGYCSRKAAKRENFTRVGMGPYRTV